MTSGSCTHTESLSGTAYEAGRKGKLFESCGENLIAAIEFLEKAKSIFYRLAEIETAHNCMQIVSMIQELEVCTSRIKESSAYKLEMAIKYHQDAIYREKHYLTAPINGQISSFEACLELYSDADDWYMKAYEALPETEHASRKRYKETMQFLLDHVSDLKSKRNERMQLAFEEQNNDLESVNRSNDMGKMRVKADVSTRMTCTQPTVEACAYSQEEMQILWRTSLINGKLFYPWIDAAHYDESLQDLSDLFTDPDGFLPLSSKQEAKFGCWKRPHEFATICGSSPVMMRSLDPLTVKQDVVTDCSFVASLCIAAAYEKRFDERLISNLIRPVDQNTNLPVYNPKGKYIVKLWANGTLRSVVIDDYLPVSKKNPNQLLCSCTTQPNELWVSLLEKAYLKLNGGYDFPGGNSGVDLFALTGWIPEQISITSLRSDRETEDRIWAQLESAFHHGHCIVTMSTEHLDKKLAKEIGLVPSHVYALLDVIEITQDAGLLRLLQVKNPWRKRSWKGIDYSHIVLQDLQSKGQTNPSSSLDKGLYGSSATHAQIDDGIFWIDLESVKSYFDSFYMNWNPDLFLYKHVRHGHWPREIGPRNDAVNLGFNPQFSISFDLAKTRTLSGEHNMDQPRMQDACIWVLLSRHVRQIAREQDSSEHYITIHVYKPEKYGQRVFYNQNAISRGTYTNNPHILVALDSALSENTSYTLVVSQYDKTAPLDYTLSVFSTTPTKFAPIPPISISPSMSFHIQGSWREETAGGRPLLGNFHRNPQYHVRLHRATARLYFFLQTEDDCGDSPVNLRVVRHYKKRVQTLTGDMEIDSSGNYRSQFCYIAMDMVGTEDCVLIPSTFEAGCEAAFFIYITCEPNVPIKTVCSVTELAPFD